MNVEAARYFQFRQHQLPLSRRSFFRELRPEEGTITP
jgi:hypothetical protein